MSGSLKFKPFFWPALIILTTIAVPAFLSYLIEHPASGAQSNSDNSLWQDVPASELTSLAGERAVSPSRFRGSRLNAAALRGLLAKAPLEKSEDARQQQVILTLPLPEGGFNDFAVEESPLLEPGLAAEFPEIKTYLGRGIDDRTAYLRFDLTPQGFHAMILSAGPTVYIDPYIKGNPDYYVSYHKRNLGQTPWVCLTEAAGAIDAAAPEPAAAPFLVNGQILRAYRLAVAATGEYTSYHGGTVAGAMAAITTTLVRINGIYERELAIRMILVNGNTRIVYTDAATDPYTNNNGSTMLGENQNNLDAAIGPDNYDLGHVFSTGGGGIASIRSACGFGTKARGVTGNSQPNGDGFDVDYVAHELGHQLGANHTFNGTTANCGNNNRRASAAYEPGSGSTIMAYAGICGAENLQAHSDDYFHSKSLAEIVAFINTTGGGCAAPSSTNNLPPAVSAGAAFTIPRGTPFTLTAIGSDPDGDALTYCWEEFDLGTASPPNTDDGTRPIFRSFNPTSSQSRTFPRLNDILTNLPSLGEALPDTTRSLNFRVTARDNRAGGGGFADSSTLVNVRAESGPFEVSSPNTATTWAGGATQTVTWTVANTNLAPVNCANVKISLSIDGGQSFPLTLLASTPNDGAANIVAPNIQSAQARIKIEAVGNIFFDINDAEITLTQSGQPLAINPSNPILTPGRRSFAYNQTFSAAGGVSPYSFGVSAGELPPGLSLLPNGVLSGTPAQAGTFNFTITVTDANNSTGSRSYSLVIIDSIANGLQYYPLPRPIRLLDTRIGATACNKPGIPLAGGQSLIQPARLTCDGVTIPATALAVVGNATVVNFNVAAGFITLYPNGATQPSSSNLNFLPSQIIPNAFTVGLGSNGEFKIFASATTHIIIDITGYYAPPGTGGLYYHPLPNPIRLLDTRTGASACAAPGAPLQAGAPLIQNARLSCNGVTIPANAAAVVGNGTVVNYLSGPGFISLSPSNATQPTVSNFNYLSNQVIPNSFTVGLGTDGAFKILASSMTNFVVDLQGYYSSEASDVNGLGLLYAPLARPIRLLDTRPGQFACETPGEPLTGGAARTQSARLTCDGVTIPASALAIAGNGTAVNFISGPGFITLWPTGSAWPTASNLNYLSNQIIPNAFTVGIDSHGRFNIFASSTTHFIADVTGSFAP